MAMVERKTLPEQAQDLLALLEKLHSEGKRTITRADIASAFERDRVLPVELAHLDYLHRLGFIEVERPIGKKAYEYYIAESAENEVS